MEILTSKTNPKIKQTASLVRSASLRRQQGLFVAEGLRLCLDAARSSLVIREVYVTAAAAEKYRDALPVLLAAAQRSYEIAQPLAEKLSDTQHTQGVFALCDIPLAPQAPLKNTGRYIALENIQNPDNLGAICRTAEALGIDGVIVGGGCDLYNPKTLRASMGAMFRLPVWDTADFLAFLADLQHTGFRLLASVPDAAALPVTEMSDTHGTVCLIGNEGNGLSAQALALCDEKITIPMRGRAESLNAAAAASILMWELMRR